MAMPVASKNGHAGHAGRADVPHSPSGAQPPCTRLELVGVGYRYEGCQEAVLKDADAAFVGGKVYAIVGQSGAGKSTLLSLISGLDICTEGDIRYNGASLRGLDRDEYRAKSVGVVFQGYNLLLGSTAAYNVALSMCISGCAAKGRKERKEAACALLEKVGIDREAAGRKVLRLSGGEQQRVGIARALSHSPDVVIADEPTGNLDEETEAAILGILARLAHDEGKCVVIVTHSDEVAVAADEVVCIRAGRLLRNRQETS